MKRKKRRKRIRRRVCGSRAGRLGVKLIFGLGNPGPEYEFSPHNMGFGVVDRLAERRSVRMGRKQAHALCGRFELNDREIWLIKPQTMMNLSGLAVREWVTRHDCDPSVSPGTWRRPHAARATLRR